MSNDKEQQLQAFARRAAKVSKALWPTNVRRSIATGIAAQTRRQLIVKSWRLRWFPGRLVLHHPLVVSGASIVMGAGMIAMLAAHLWFTLALLMVVLLLPVILLTRLSNAQRSKHSAQTGLEWKSFPGKERAPETPMPGEPPLIRVLETFDLSQTNVEHFLDLPDGGNTGGYSLKNWKEAQTSLPRISRNW